MIVADVQSTALMLWCFLLALVQQRPHANSCDITPYYGKLFMICAILANIWALSLSIKFQTALGLHLYNISVKQRCLAVLHNFSVTAFYTAVFKVQKEIEGVSRVCAPIFENLKAPQALQADNVFEVFYI